MDEYIYFGKVAVKIGVVEIIGPNIPSFTFLRSRLFFDF